MNPLRTRFINYMVLRGLSSHTQAAYLRVVTALAKHYQRSPDQLSNDEIQAFLVHVISERKLAWNSVNVYFWAIRCFYQKVLHRDSSHFHIPPRGRARRRPVVLSRQAVERILLGTTNIKHQALLAMVYGSGLRVSEVCRLRPSHIESAPDRMMVRIEQGKGHKDRYTLLSEKALDTLRTYWRAYRPGEWLFAAPGTCQPLSTRSAQRIYDQACERVGIVEAHGIHSLRHAFATHLVENGVQLVLIKQWMGHRSIVTTAGYCHLAREYGPMVKSPLDVPFQARA